MKEILRAIVIDVIATPCECPERRLEGCREEYFLHLIRFNCARNVCTGNRFAKIGPVRGGSPVIVKWSRNGVDCCLPIAAGLELLDSEVVNIPSLGEMPGKRYPAHGERSLELHGTEAPFVKIESRVAPGGIGDAEWKARKDRRKAKTAEEGAVKCRKA